MYYSLTYYNYNGYYYMLAYKDLAKDLFYNGNREIVQLLGPSYVRFAHPMYTFLTGGEYNGGWASGFMIYKLSYDGYVMYQFWDGWGRVSFHNTNAFYDGQPISHYPRLVLWNNADYGTGGNKTEQRVYLPNAYFEPLNVYCGDQSVSGYYIYIYNSEIYLFGPQIGTKTNTFYKYYTYYTGYTYSHVYSWTTYYNYTIPAVYYGKYTYTTQYTYTTLYNYLYTGNYYTNLYT